MADAPKNPFRPTTVSSFGGGLHFTDHPAAMQDHQWSWCENMVARDGCAEMWPSYGLLATLAVPFPLGAVQNPFTQDGALVATWAAGDNVRLWTVTGGGVITEITPTALALKGRQNAVLTAAFLNGYLVVSVGMPNGGGHSLARWTGGATYERIDAAVLGGPTTVEWDWICNFSGRIVGGSGEVDGVAAINESNRRTVGWCDADNEAIWSPAVSNSADQVFVDDVMGRIAGVAPLGDQACVILHGEGADVLTPTGGIPAFTRQALVRGVQALLLTPPGGNTPFYNSYFGTLPTGVLFIADDGVYVITSSGLKPIGTLVNRYVMKEIVPTIDTTTVTGLQRQGVVWHPCVKTVLFPRPGLGLAGASNEYMVWHLGSGAWSRIKPLSGTTIGIATRHAFIRSYGPGGTAPLKRRHWILDNSGKIFEEGSVAANGAYVVTKPFTSGAEPVDVQYRTLKVAWETLENPATAAIDVLVATQKDLNIPTILGSEGLEQQAQTFVPLGTLTAGNSELPMRIRGKYTWLKFKQNTGGARIRGFTFESRIGSGRRT